MAYENLIYEKKHGIAWITFNRPKVLNALNRKTIEELQAILTDARDDTAVRVLILTGSEEKAFVAGADINELAQQTPVHGKEFSLYGQGVFHLLETIGKPSMKDCCTICATAIPRPGGHSSGMLTSNVIRPTSSAKPGKPTRGMTQRAGVSPQAYAGNRREGRQRTQRPT